MAHVRYLADDALEGRGTASEGGRCAGDYIASNLAEAGLEPAGDDGTYFQSFPVRKGSQLADPGSFQLRENPEADLATVSAQAWTPFGFSGSGEVSGALVYGADAPAATEGEGDDAEAAPGPIMVIEASPSDATSSRFSVDPHYQGSVAQGRGAAALVLLVDQADDLPELELEDRPFLRIPVVAVSGEAAETVRAAAQSGTATARMATAVEPRMAQARNVVAMIPGTDPSMDGEVVIVGAHYDHLGFGGEGSLAPGVHAIHNGADDNASGTAALIEVAEALAGTSPARSILFMAFSGEERGLLGSAHFVREPTVPLDDAVAMINMDMVGRMRDNTLTVFGLATAPEWEGALNNANGQQPEALNMVLMPDGYGPSDHSSFYGAGIPVLHFFTNTHSLYHRPEDDWETINGRGLDRIAALVTTLTGAVAGGDAEGDPVQLTLVETQAPAPSGEGRSRGYGPYFGSVPDMGYQDFGVRLQGVREGSPAANAGLRDGDVIVAFGGNDVGDLYAYTYALREMAPGDVVEVVVIRDEQRINVQAVLGERR